MYIKEFNRKVSWKNIVKARCITRNQQKTTSRLRVLRQNVIAENDLETQYHSKKKHNANVLLKKTDMVLLDSKLNNEKSSVLLQNFKSQFRNDQGYIEPITLDCNSECNKIDIDCVPESLAKNINSEMRYHCNKCGKEYSERSDLKRHRNTCYCKKQCICHKCGKSFPYYSSLRYHMKHVHLGIKEHTCNFCSQSFSQKHFLKSHLRTHTGERPFVCDLCGKTFKTSAALYIHNVSHTQEYKYTCNVCPFKTMTLYHLKRHMIVHTGEKNFVCTVCKKQFAYKNSLNRHAFIHSVDSCFSCALCSSSFKVERYLTRHMKAKHKS